MIYITKLNEKKIVINSELILSVESTPDTTISMTTGHKYIARESVDDIINSVVEYKRTIYAAQKKLTEAETAATGNGGKNAENIEATAEKENIINEATETPANENPVQTNEETKTGDNPE